MLESTRIDVYALRSASRRAGAAANKPGRNSRSPDFVLELSSEVWFRVFVTFRDSNLGVPVTNVSQGTDIEDPATGCEKAGQGKAPEADRFNGLSAISCRRWNIRKCGPKEMEIKGGPFA